MFEILLILKCNFTTKIRHKWGCATKIVNGTSECNSRHINEDVLEATYLAALNELIENAAEVVDAVKEGAGMTLEPENKAALEQVDEDIIKVQEAVLALHKAKQRMEIGAQDYAAKVKEYSEQMKALEAKRDELQATEVKFAEVKAWLDTFIAQTMKADALTEIDGITMKMLVEKIIARDTGIEVVFKCGVAIEKEYVR